jgi:hypothetical protein
MNVLERKMQLTLDLSNKLLEEITKSLGTMDNTVNIIIMYCFYNWLNEGSISEDIKNCEASLQNLFDTSRRKIDELLRRNDVNGLIPQLDTLKQKYKDLNANQRALMPGHFDSNASLSLLQTMDRLTNIMGINSLSTFSPTDQ